MSSFVAADLKARNRATIYSLLSSSRGLSKADLARESGISAPTVQKIVEYFGSLKLIREADEAEDSEGVRPPSAVLGRRPRLLRFDPSAAFAIGAEYDGVHLSVGVVDLAGSPQSLVRRMAPPEVRSILAEFLEPVVDEALRSAGVGRAAIVGLGLGLPGTVDPDGRTLRFAPLVGIDEPEDFGDLLDALESRLGFPIVLENDANAAALGEYAARSLGDGGDLLFAVLGRGLGAGLILDGKLRKGPRAFTGEIGYMSFETGSESTLADPGWLESRIDLASFWAEAEGPGGPSEAALERVAANLALCLADICIALDLPRVVIGRADREPFGARLLELIGNKLRRIAVLELACEAPAAQEPGVSGAAGLAMESWLRGVFAGP